MDRQDLERRSPWKVCDIPILGTESEPGINFRSIKTLFDLREKKKEMKYVFSVNTNLIIGKYRGNIQ